MPARATRFETMRLTVSLKSLRLCLAAAYVLAPAIACAAALAPPTPEVALKPFSSESSDDHTGAGLAIAAIVNDEVVSGYDLDQGVKLLVGSSGVQPSPEEMARIKAQVLRQLIDEKLKMQETKRLKVEVKDSEVEDQLNYIASRNNTTVDEVKKQLAKQGVALSTLKNQIRADLQWNELVQGRYGPDVNIDPAEVQRLIDKAKSNADKPQYDVVQIFLGVDSPNDDAKVKQQAIDLIGQLKQGHPFEQLAQNFSQDASAANGGEIGWVFQGELAKPLDDWLRTAHRNEVTQEPIRTIAGYYVLAVRGTRNVAAPPTPVGEVHLMQILVPLDTYASADTAKRTRDQLIAAARTVKSCDKIDAAFASIPSAKVEDISPRPLKALPAPFQERVAKLTEGTVSTDPMRSDEGWITVALCGEPKSAANDDGDDDASAKGVPTEDSIKQQLFEQQISMLSRRYLRDLRRDAVIDSRIAEQ